jgi:hypothetical protein
MSDLGQGHDPHGHDRPVQEEDRLPMAKVSFVLAVIVLLTLGGVLFSRLVLDEREQALRQGERPAPPQDVVPRPSGVDQTLFSEGPYSRTFVEAQRRRLRSYEWVDREQRIVRIPIDKAMELRLKERK